MLYTDSQLNMVKAWKNPVDYMMIIRDKYEAELATLTAERDDLTIKLAAAQAELHDLRIRAGGASE